VLDFERYVKTRCDRLEHFLKQCLPQPSVHPRSARLYEALRYTVLDAGKRLRPLLVYATGEAMGVSLDKLDAPAAAIELIHCYSLIHDDLPAMDDDAIRRGKASCHKAFDEATAILAGDALQSLAFEILSNPRLNPAEPLQQVARIQILAKNSGMHGMVEGQILDMAYQDRSEPLAYPDLCEIHLKKTAALIEASVMCGMLNTPKTLENKHILALKSYARCLGLCFQIQDDILDAIGDEKTLRKKTGRDQEKNKATFPGYLGLEESGIQLLKLHQKALDHLAWMGPEAEALLALSKTFIRPFHFCPSSTTTLQ
jgi:farnesyl diphosphate synthase